MSGASKASEKTPAGEGGGTGGRVALLEKVSRIGGVEAKAEMRDTALHEGEATREPRNVVEQGGRHSDGRIYCGQTGEAGRQLEARSGQGLSGRTWGTGDRGTILREKAGEQGGTGDTQAPILGTGDDKIVPEAVAQEPEQVLGEGPEAGLPNRPPPTQRAWCPRGGESGAGGLR